MKLWYAVGVLATPFAVLVAAADRHPALGPSSAETRREIEAVVRAQLEAFAESDWARAYGFAAAGIREKFDRDAFEGMVRGSYPALLAAKSVAVLATADNGTAATLDLRIVATDGTLAWFRYFLSREEGAWRIVGVVPADPPSVAA